MEIVENCQQKYHCLNSNNQEKKAVKIKCIKKYVQPPRVKPFAPRTTYCAPKNPIESKTTYYSSYYNENLRQARPQPCLPIHSIFLNGDKFSNDTTNKLSFKPVWGIPKAKPILPYQRICPQKGPMENTTTIRRDYAPKYAPKAEPIKPCGHIRFMKTPFEGTTTTLYSYMNPGPVEPVQSFRPNLRYCRPQEPTAKETTQKLSYLPYHVGKKENYPWARKPVYRRPDVSMPGETTYSKSYLENKAAKLNPILPKDTGVFPCGAQFVESTIYKESFLPRQLDSVGPILPRANIFLSDKEMECDTTNKLSFQPVRGEKRKPIMPRRRKILADLGFNQNVTTTQLSFTPKSIKRAQMIIPCGHITTVKQPLEDKTTTALSYLTPERVNQFSSFRPALKYCKPEEKIEGDTVNKLSYPQWSIGPKELIPWAQKPRFQPPKDKMESDTVAHMSFTPPGHFIEECEPINDCPCPPEEKCDQ